MEALCLIGLVIALAALADAPRDGLWGGMFLVFALAWEFVVPYLPNPPGGD